MLLPALSSPLQPPLRHPTEPGGLTLSQVALSILRRPGLESHVFLPGVGWVGGYALTNAIMEDGTQAASVDNPVGYMGDAVATLGAELVTNGDFSSGTGWTLASGFTVSGGFLNASGVAAFSLASTPITLVAGRSYQVTYTIVSVTAGGARAHFAGGTAVNSTSRTTPGTYTEVVTAATGNTSVAVQATGGGFSGVIDNISVRELVGAIPARQATTANKPILRRGAVNRATQSENILTASGYTLSGNGTLTRNQTAPNGTLTASLLTEGTAATSQWVSNPGSVPFVAGVTYTLSWYVKAGSATRVQLTFLSGAFGTGQYANFGLSGAGAVLASAGGTASISLDSEGFYRCRFTATCTTTATGSAGLLAFINSDTATRLPGYTATNLNLIVWGAQLETGSTASPYIPTTTAPASSPTGPYWLEYDGTDFLSLAAVPFQQADDHCVVTAAQPTNLSNPITCFSVRSSVSANPIVCSIRADGVQNRFRAAYRDDAGTLFFVDGPVGLMAGTRYVISVRRVAGNAVTRTNGVSGVSTSIAALGATTVNGAAIGVEPLGTPTQQFIGAIYPVIVVKGTVTDAELATLERWVASLSGVTL